MSQSSKMDFNATDLDKKCLEIRHAILDIFEHGGRGHLPSAFSLVEILTVLYYRALNFSAELFRANEHDTIILSKGHGCLAQYAILSDLGLLTKEQLENYGKTGSVLGGHPASFKTPGIELSTGSLGHGLSFALGKALALKKLGLDKRVAVVLGDGECQEGSVWEAALSIGKHSPSNLTVLVDYNKAQSFGGVQSVCPLEPFKDKWEAFGLRAYEVDMVSSPLDLAGIMEEEARGTKVILCHTIKGQGSSLLMNDPSWHHRTRTDARELEALRGSLT